MVNRRLSFLPKNGFLHKTIGVPSLSTRNNWFRYIKKHIYVKTKTFFYFEQN